MIKFFRRIRRQLLNENKFSKYLLYAIGEIILVVIGILIALSINNWNENKKDKSFELKMLTEIKRALISDLNHTEKLIVRVKRAQSTSYSMLENIYNNVLYKDSMWRGVNRLITGIQYQQTLGPYEAIKSVGLDKISNDSLRNHIIAFYDFSYPRQKALILWYDKSYDKNFREIKDFMQPTEIYSIENDSLSWRKRFKPFIFQNPKFLEYVTSVEMWSSNTFEVLNHVQPEMKELIAEIESEIKK